MKISTNNFNLKNISKYTFFSFIPFLSLGILTIFLFFLKVIPLYYLYFAFIGWILIAGLGTEMGFHRIFSHKQYKNLPTWKENIILFLGSLGGQGSSITWASIHGQHHKYADKELDLHSPQTHSKWYSVFGWSFNITENNNPMNFKYSMDLIRKSNHEWFHKHQLKILWLTPLIVALFDWKLSLSLIIFPSAISAFITNFINLSGHSNFIGNYRNYDIDNCSQNNVIIGMLSWGLGYHNNHHYDPTKFISCKWWEFDPCVIFVPLFK